MAGVRSRGGRYPDVGWLADDAGRVLTITSHGDWGIHAYSNQSVPRRYRDAHDSAIRAPARADDAALDHPEKPVPGAIEDALLPNRTPEHLR